MHFTSKEIVIAAGATDRLAFLQDIRRHELPIYSTRFGNGNQYDLTSFAVSMVIGELREYGLSLSSCGRLLSRVDLDDLSHKTAKLHLDEIHDLIVLVPQRDDLDESFPTCVTSWDAVRHFGKEESINFIPITIGDLLKAKTTGEW